MIYLKNSIEKQKIYVPRTKIDGKLVIKNKTYDDGYNEGHFDGVTEGYASGYDTGFSNGRHYGRSEGIEIQKSKLEDISITENGIYSREDGYKNIVVEVPDLNGSYDDGYDDGSSDGYKEGHYDGLRQGLNDGINYQYEKMVNDSEVLNITENGVYFTKYSKEEDSSEEIPSNNNRNFIRTVNANIVPKINVAKEGITFAYSKITEVPEWVDWEGIRNMDRMFFYSSFKELPMIDTSNVTSMEYMCNYLSGITTIPQYDTRNVLSMSNMLSDCVSLLSLPLLNTSNVSNFRSFVYRCEKLTTFPEIETSNATDINGMFGSCNSLTTIPPLNAGKVTNTGSFFGYGELKNLTNFGGLIGLKASMNDNYGFKNTPNLTYESCINVLNGLYDFVGNGETPTSSQGKLKVHSNFLTTVGDELSIGTDKGWTITA